MPSKQEALVLLVFLFGSFSGCVRGSVYRPADRGAVQIKVRHNSDSNIVNSEVSYSIGL